MRRLWVRLWKVAFLIHSKFPNIIIYTHHLTLLTFCTLFLGNFVHWVCVDVSEVETCREETCTEREGAGMGGESLREGKRVGV